MFFSFLQIHSMRLLQISDFCLLILQVTLDDNFKVSDFRIIWSSSPESSKYQSYFSLPEFIEFPTEVPGQTAYAYFYSPSNPMYQASQEEKPPLLLKSHGMLYNLHSFLKNLYYLMP